MEYTIVSKQTLDELEEAVASFINDGWTPQGGVAIRSQTAWSPETYVQALIKE